MYFYFFKTAFRPQTLCVGFLHVVLMECLIGIQISVFLPGEFFGFEACMAKMEKFLTACHRYLHGMQGHKDFDKLREEQFQNCCHKLKGVSFDMEEAAAIVDKLSGMNWGSSQLATLQGLVSVQRDDPRGVSLAASQIKRRKLQNYFPLILDAVLVGEPFG